jgi:hypothetical protein
MFVGLSTAGLPSVALRLVVALAAIGLFLFGLWQMRRRTPVTSAFFAAYLAIVLLWPFTPARFVWGVWPIVALVFAVGVKDVLAWNPNSPAMRAARGFVAAAALGVVIGYGVYNTRGYRGAWWSSIPKQTAGVAVPTVVWIGEHTRPSDVISTNAELMTYLYTGRLAVPATSFSVGDYFAAPRASSRAAALRSILGAYRIDVVAVIANDSLEAGARSLAAAQPPVLSLRDSVPRGLLFSSNIR